MMSLADTNLKFLLLNGGLAVNGAKILHCMSNTSVQTVLLRM